MDHLLTRVPVNKLAAVMVNQCHCSTELELNGLLEQREQLKANATKWMQESSKGIGAKRKNKPFIKRANRDLLALNEQLRPYDEWHRNNTPKDYDHAFRVTVRKVFGSEIFKQLELQAKAACDS